MWRKATDISSVRIETIFCGAAEHGCPLGMKDGKSLGWADGWFDLRGVASARVDGLLI